MLPTLGMAMFASDICFISGPYVLSWKRKPKRKMKFAVTKEGKVILRGKISAKKGLRIAYYNTHGDEHLTAIFAKIDTLEESL